MTNKTISKMICKNSIFKLVLLMGISALALTACETSDWFEDDATYAGNVKPPVQGVETAAAPASPISQVVPPPSQEILQTLPAPVGAPQYTSSLTPTSTPMAPVPAMAAPMATSQFTGNLAAVPPRPAASDLPSAQQVASTRQDLTADNQQLQQTLKDPNAALPSETATRTIVQSTTTMMPGQVPQNVTTTMTTTAPVAPTIIPQAPLMPTQSTLPTAGQVIAAQQAGQPMPMPQQPTYAPPMPVYAAQQPAMAPQYPMAAVPAPTDQNVSGRMLGLQPSGPGKYSLVQLVPDAGIGSFSMAGSIVTGQPGNQINIDQYQDLRRIAAQYATQKGRVRLVAYSDNPMSQDALQRETTIAAYLIDLGVPSSAMRLRIDPVVGDASPSSPNARKTDIFLEVPLNK